MCVIIIRNEDKEMLRNCFWHSYYKNKQDENNLPDTTPQIHLADNPLQQTANIKISFVKRIWKTICLKTKGR